LLWDIGSFDGEHEWKFVRTVPEFLIGASPMDLIGSCPDDVDRNGHGTAPWAADTAGLHQIQFKRSFQIADVSSAGVCLARKSPGPPFVVGYRLF
jgi:hypothetical protein